jgi:hypothetical protein
VSNARNAMVVRPSDAMIVRSQRPAILRGALVMLMGARLHRRGSPWGTRIMATGMRMLWALPRAEVEAYARSLGGGILHGCLRVALVTDPQHRAPPETQAAIDRVVAEGRGPDAKMNPPEAAGLDPWEWPALPANGYTASATRQRLDRIYASWGPHDAGGEIRVCSGVAPPCTAPARGRCPRPRPEPARRGFWRRGKR